MAVKGEVRPVESFGIRPWPDGKLHGISDRFKRGTDHTAAVLACDRARILDAVWRCEDLTVGRPECLGLGHTEGAFIPDM